VLGPCCADVRLRVRGSRELAVECVFCALAVAQSWCIGSGPLDLFPIGTGEMAAQGSGDRPWQREAFDPLPGRTWFSAVFVEPALLSLGNALASLPCLQCTSEQGQGTLSS
jgi:hypothetical protein